MRVHPFHGFSADFIFLGGISNSCNSNTITVYGSSQSVPCQYFALDHRFYFFAPLTGSYTFTFSGIDDIAILWSQALAQSGWTRSNANLVTTHMPFRDGQGTYTITLTAQQYLPLRVVFANAQGAAGFQFAITDPNGTRIVDSSASRSSSPYLVQYSCDGTSAPRFAGAFGQET